jgi:hypothetical protein
MQTNRFNFYGCNLKKVSVSQAFKIQEAPFLHPKDSILQEYTHIKQNDINGTLMDFSLPIFVSWTQHILIVKWVRFPWENEVREHLISRQLSNTIFQCQSSQKIIEKCLLQFILNTANWKKEDNCFFLFLFSLKCSCGMNDSATPFSDWQKPIYSSVYPLPPPSHPTVCLHSSHCLPTVFLPVFLDRQKKTCLHSIHC